ncbi:Murein DD-endopeptidase MepM and murein hydrolase activator NlpD, contain LysM domain [Sphingomonas gellani]|uniref:Murein DD-endopeptidase MepM and murein hydrolase activator NlpD, contain LysM domain n=1 Tax=Sphingomonas gellani TaxID=1166340 RepID=A0A1H7Z057_9SPHN|nr:LysM peptidoglycan-binding domain-containing M23 family metallopeptidase [Sphingomonas gellani]SEM50978.1 Murein DD-endopeptidase MepM and murein hydrolase activator NlpD, contain LysM domain [Sphingomonas gellani]
MRRSVVAMGGALWLCGCIPQVDAPPAEAYRARPAPLPEAEPADQDRPPRRAPDRGYEPSPPWPAVRQSPLVTPPTDTVSALPAPRPAWETRPVAADAGRIAEDVYVAVPGDTLGRVAERTRAGADAIAWANGLQPPFTILAGQRLRIPGGRYHLIRPGQTGIGIARAYGIEWSRIIAVNGLSEPFVLRVGQRVLIPDAPSGGPSLAERAAAFSLDVDDILTGGEPALAKDEAPARPAATPRRVLPATAAVVAPARLAGGFVWPVDGRVVKRFGRGGSGERNDGIKIAVPLNTPVHATADGVVAYVGSGIAALGGLVIVKHGDRWTSVYGHASKLMVQRGQAVKRGQTIALSGDTGFADRPELHFELRKGRVPVDPLGQLPPG